MMLQTSERTVLIENNYVAYKRTTSDKWIEECGGPWGSSIILSAKPQKDHVSNIDDFYMAHVHILSEAKLYQFF